MDHLKTAIRIDKSFGELAERNGDLEPLRGSLVWQTSLRKGDFASILEGVEWSSGSGSVLAFKPKGVLARMHLARRGDRLRTDVTLGTYKVNGSTATISYGGKESWKVSFSAENRGLVVEQIGDPEDSTLWLDPFGHCP